MITIKGTTGSLNMSALFLGLSAWINSVNASHFVLFGLGVTEHSQGFV